MTTVEAKIPEAVLKQARELAEREKIPLEQIISLAVTQAVGIWSNERRLDQGGGVAPFVCWEQTRRELETGFRGTQGGVTRTCFSKHNENEVTTP